jgi:hypothetical protein
MFLDNGHVVQVDLDNHDPPVDIGQIWQPIAPQYWADAKVWRPRFFASVAGQNGGVLFGSPQGLYAWDGTTLTSPGQTAPDWLTDALETTPPPPVTTMPTGLPGIYAMEVYASRLWVAGKDVIAFSAPGNGAEFAAVNGGGSFGYFGDKLTYSFMALAEVAGFLFAFGDSSTHLINNVQLLGTGTVSDPFVTNLNFQNVDPQVGQRYPRHVGSVGRRFQMANGAGVFEITGGDARPIGDKITKVWTNLDDSLYLPTFATMTKFGFRVLLLNGRFTDPFGVTRNLLLMWHPERGREFWSIASQRFEMTNIGHYEQDSTIRPYGTDGNSLYELFFQPDPLLPKRLSTKALRGQGLARLVVKNFKRLYLEFHDDSGGGVSITGAVTCDGGGMPGGEQECGFELSAGVGFEVGKGQVSTIEPYPITGAGIAAAIDLASSSPDFTIVRLHLAAEERTLFGA